MNGLWVVVAIGCATIVWGQNSGDAATVTASPGGSVSDPVNGVGGSREGGKVSSVRMFLWNLGNDRQVLYGSVPMVYKILGLTGEQIKAIESLCQEAKAESATIYKTARSEADGGQGAARGYRAVQKKQDELFEKYQARILDVLTPQQREALNRLRILADEKCEADRKINEEFRKLNEANLERFEGKLNGLLTDEQKAKLEELFAAQKKRAENVKVHVQGN